MGCTYRRNSYPSRRLTGEANYRWVLVPFCTIFCRKGVRKRQCFAGCSDVPTISAQLGVHCPDLPPHRSSRGLALLLLRTSLTAPYWERLGGGGRGEGRRSSRAGAWGSCPPPALWLGPELGQPHGSRGDGRALPNAPHAGREHRFTLCGITAAPSQTLNLNHFLFISFAHLCLCSFDNSP